MNKFSGTLICRIERTSSLFLLDSSTHHKQACEENEFEVGHVKQYKEQERKKQERPKSVLKQVVAVGVKVMQQVAMHHFDSVQL